MHNYVSYIMLKRDYLIPKESEICFSEYFFLRENKSATNVLFMLS